VNGSAIKLCKDSDLEGGGETSESDVVEQHGREHSREYDGY
jgi:hypothetical protein